MSVLPRAAAVTALVAASLLTQPAARAGDRPAVTAPAVTAPAVTAPAVTAALSHCTDHSPIEQHRKDRIVKLPSIGYKTRAIGCLLGSGDRNAGVFVLQLALHDCNNSDLAVDGIYGNQTRDVIAFIQAAKGLSPDGVYGPDTARRLRWPAYSPTNVLLDCNGECAKAV
jgi:peptidoglycan hydrolase-like protein with peptidoglycan-binding domain